MNDNETVADVLADMRHPFFKEDVARFADRLERALSQQQPVCEGSGFPQSQLIGRTIKWHCASPPDIGTKLYATPQPEPKPAAVEYDRALIADMLKSGVDGGMKYSLEAIAEQVRLLEAADNADAAGVRTVRREPAKSPDAASARALRKKKTAVEWTDDECREFASIAFRHARRNLPSGVTFQDIRHGAYRVDSIRAAALTAALQEGKSHDQ